MICSTLRRDLLRLERITEKIGVMQGHRASGNSALGGKVATIPLSW